MTESSTVNHLDDKSAFDASATHRIATVVGNPKAASRTLTAAIALARALTARLWEPAGGTVASDTFDLAEIADGLLAPWRLSPAGEAAVRSVRAANVVVLATPTYKASYTGLLKLFLDVFPAGSLSATVVVPLIVSGGPAHRHLGDLQLRPVLSELGAVVPAPSFLLEESEFPQLGDLVTTYVGLHGELITSTVSAVAISRDREEVRQ
jgi:FMN reductase